MYGGRPAQRVFGPPAMPGWRPPFQPAPRPASAAPVRPNTETASIQRPPVTEQSATGQPGMQFVPTQVNTSLYTLAQPL